MTNTSSSLTQASNPAFKETFEQNQDFTAKHAAMEGRLKDTADDLRTMLSGLPPDDWPALKTVPYPAEDIAAMYAATQEFFEEQESARIAQTETVQTLVAEFSAAMGWDRDEHNESDDAEE